VPTLVHELPLRGPIGDLPDEGRARAGPGPRAERLTAAPDKT
jgi:hypothetical protein